MQINRKKKTLHDAEGGFTLIYNYTMNILWIIESLFYYVSRFYATTNHMTI